MGSGNDPVAEFASQLRETPLKPPEIARLLDEMSHEQRVAAVRSLGRSDQRKLYAAVDGFRPVSLTDLVAPSVGDGIQVRHFGKNTLPVFSHFEKRFVRPQGADPVRPGVLHGYNFGSTSSITGPGYFVARDADARDEVLVDYREVPTTCPEGWPPIRPNDRGLARFVFGFMVDTLRGVSEHVSIGSAARHGRDLGSWFALCREA
jgi:hypothetical protein